MTTPPTSTIHVGVLSPHSLVVHGVTAVAASYDATIAVRDLGAVRGRAHDPAVHVTLVDSALVAAGSPRARAVVGSATSLVLVRPEHADDRAVRSSCPAETWVPMTTNGPTLVNTIRRVARAADVGPTGGAARAGEVGAVRCGHLSPRELEVLREIGRGRSNDEIAAALYLSVNTVKTYVRTAYRKIGVTRRAEAVAWFMTSGLHDRWTPDGVA